MDRFKKAKICSVFNTLDPLATVQLSYLGYQRPPAASERGSQFQKNEQRFKFSAVGARFSRSSLSSQ